MTPGNVDWFGNFDSIVANAGTAAWLVRQGGAKGIFFDTEDYESPLWHYPSQALKNSKTFAQYTAQVRLRGQQVMAAMQAESPNLILMLPVSYSYVWGPSQINGNQSLLPSVEYGLLPAFLDGMLDVAGAGVRFIDGFENANGYESLSQFQAARARIVSGTLPIVADDARYAEKFGVGFVAWMDAFWRTQGWHSNPTDFDQNYYTPEEFQEVTRSALQTSDEYVWVYSEQMFWRRSNTAGSPDVPQAYEDAVRASIVTLPGDYDNDGKVDTADYIVWRKNQGTTNMLLNDPIGGTVGSAQFNQWRANFGRMAGSVGLSSGPAAVPEPQSALLLVVALTGLLTFRLVPSNRGTRGRCERRVSQRRRANSEWIIRGATVLQSKGSVVLCERQQFVSPLSNQRVE